MPSEQAQTQDTMRAKLPASGEMPMFASGMANNVRLVAALLDETKNTPKMLG
jgi:hypothetical protein